MELKYNRLLIFDGSYCLHRNLSVPNNWNMITTSGKRTGGIFGVLRTIYKELKTYNYFPVVVFDGGLSQRRLNLYPNYKQHEDKLLNESLEAKSEADLLAEEFKREYNTQRNDLIELLPAFGIPVIYETGWEGDDLIYILSKLCENSIVVSDDKDLIQLIHEPDDEDTRLCRIRRALRDEFLDMNSLKEQNLNIKEYIGCKSIIGDPSDNIPSACYQVGDKTALGLYKLFENVTKDNIQFPSNEDELNKLCKKYNITKRKAYLNFNIDQFYTNFLLTDLSLVDEDISDDIINYINVIIDSEQSNIDLNTILNAFKQFEINSFDYNNLINRVKSLSHMIYTTDKDLCNNVVDINKKHTLF